MNPLFWDQPILAIESSCDETAASVVSGREVLSNVVASQIEMHQKWGGVVPEAAARAHVEAIVPVVQEALDVAGIDHPHAIAVTNRPGLVGALSVGAAAAKSLALAWKIPVIGVHHIEGHIMSPWGDPDIEVAYPNITLVVSGGHTELVHCPVPGKYEVIAETLDDAAGEAFDKGARLLGLGYPGGKAIQEAAVGGNPKRYKLPRALPKEDDKFSFSGLKTAVLRVVQKEGTNVSVSDLAASLQQAVVDALVVKAMRAVDEHEVDCFSLVGGVSANILLRETLKSECAKRGVTCCVPPFALCTDNAAMIGLAGSFRLAQGFQDDMSLDVFPNGELPSIG